LGKHSARWDARSTQPLLSAKIGHGRSDLRFISIKQSKMPPLVVWLQDSAIPVPDPYKWSAALMITRSLALGVRRCLFAPGRLGGWWWRWCPRVRNGLY